MAWPGTPVRAAGRIPAGRIPARATERTSGPEARAQVRVFSPLADGLSQTMGRRGAGCHGWVGWHLQPYKHCWQGRRAPCDCLPTGKDPAIRQGPRPPPVTALLCRDLRHAPILPAFMRHTHTPICSYCTDHLRKVPQGLLTPVPWRGEHGWGQPPVRSFVSPGF